MQGLTELDILKQLVDSVIVLIAWMVPTSVVVRCRRRYADIDENSICYRIAQFSKEHPVLLTVIVSTPALLLIFVVSSMDDLLFLTLFPVIAGFTIVNIIVAWRTKDFPL